MPEYKVNTISNRNFSETYEVPEDAALVSIEEPFALSEAHFMRLTQSRGVMATWADGFLAGFAILAVGNILKKLRGKPIDRDDLWTLGGALVLFGVLKLIGQLRQSERGKLIATIKTHFGSNKRLLGTLRREKNDQA